MKSRQVTVWSERYEVFLEHEAIVAGSGVRFVTHVTNLETLEPRREGPVEFVLVSGAERKVVEAAAPDRPGIYVPEIELPNPGRWEVSLRIPDANPAHEIELGEFEVHATREEALRSTMPDAPEGISFLKEQQWKVLFETAPVTRAPVVERKALPGVIRARPGGRALVSPPLAGTLLPLQERPLPSPGDTVEAGQVLGLVQPPALDLLARIAEAESAAILADLTVERSERLLERTRKLAEEQARSARDVEEAEFAAKRARIDREAALAVQAAYRRIGTYLPTREDDGGESTPALEVTAPISGVITEVRSVPGEQVSPERPVAEILDPARVYIEARVPEVDLGQLTPDLGASVETPDRPGHLAPIVPGRGRVVLVGPVIDPDTRTAPILYEVENPEGRLRIGMAVTVHVETGRSEEALVVPRSAVVDEDVRSVAFVQVSGEAFEKRDLTLGIRDGDVVQVLRGLNEGERVVVQGAYAVRLASVAAAIPAHGHAH